MHARCPSDANARCNSRCRVGEDRDSIHVTFRPDDDSNAPKATPAPGSPAKAQGPQPAAASRSASDPVNGFPSPVEKGSAKDFWGGQSEAAAAAAEDVVQIPIEGIPDKVRLQGRSTGKYLSKNMPLSTSVTDLSSENTRCDPPCNAVCLCMLHIAACYMSSSRGSQSCCHAPVDAEAAADCRICQWQRCGDGHRTHHRAGGNC